MTTLPKSRNFTRSFVWLVSSCLFLVSSCDQSGSEKSLAPRISAIKVPSVGIDELIRNQETYLNKRVHVSGYLLTHEEGPWLAGNPDSPLRDALLLDVSVDFQLHDQEGSKIRWFEHDPKGRAVVISGVFSMMNQKLPMGQEFRKRPFVRVDSVVVVERDP